MMNSSYMPPLPRDDTLKLLLERCAEESVDEERVRRMLEPVLRMIREGRFSRRRRAARVARPVAVATAVVITAAVIQSAAECGPLIDIPSTQIPLSGLAAPSQTLAGRILWKDAGLDGVPLTLLTAGGQVVGTAVTDEDGGYYFTDIRRGSYLLRAELPPGFALVGGGNEAVLDINDPKARKGMNIWVYETGT